MPCIRNVNVRHNQDFRAPSPSPTPSCPSSSRSSSQGAPITFPTRSDLPSHIPLHEPSNTDSKSVKSHARKREEGHIKRPSNAFILFRTDFVANGHIPSSIESHSQNLSRIAGTIWRSMSATEKEPWVRKAHEVKEEHARMFPGYEYHPTDSYALRGRRKVVKGRGEGEVKAARKRCRVLAELVKNGKEKGELERAVGEIIPETQTRVPVPVCNENAKAESQKRERERRRRPVEVNKFDRIEPIFEEHVSTATEEVFRPCPLDDAPITVPTSVEALLAEPLPGTPPPPSREDTPATGSSSSQSSPPSMIGASLPFLNLPNTFIPASSPSTHKVSLPPLLNLPNTFIPGSESASTGGVSSSSSFSSGRPANISEESLHLPPIRSPSTRHSALPSKIGRVGAPPIFPGALHVPDKLKGLSGSPDSVPAPSFQNVLPSKVRSYGAPPALQIPRLETSSSSCSSSSCSLIPREQASECGIRRNEPWTLRQVNPFPSRPSGVARRIGVAIRGHDCETDLESEESSGGCESED